MTEENESPDTPTTTYEEYTTAVAAKLRDYPHWRRGQAAFNMLWEMRPELADKIATGPRDPFYRDDRLPDFLGWVEENWSK